MPDVWRDKDERMYQHIKQSQLDDGKSEDEAEEIASRTVNKQRREEGLPITPLLRGQVTPIPVWKSALKMSYTIERSSSILITAVKRVKMN